jgi:hypothetical protein
VLCEAVAITVAPASLAGWTTNTPTPPCGAADQDRVAGLLADRLQGRGWLRQRGG